MHFRTACLVLLIGGVAMAQEPSYEGLLKNTEKLDDAARLQKLFETEWEYGIREYPEFATSLGRNEFDDRWTDNSTEAIERRKFHYKKPLEVIESIDRNKLSKADQLNYDLCRRDLEREKEGVKFLWYYLAINQMSGVQNDVSQTLEDMPQQKVKDYENILARLEKVSVLIANDIGHLKEGLKKGVTYPQVVLREVPKQIENVIPTDALKSPLLKVFEKFPEEISKEEQERLRKKAVEIYKGKLVPAYAELKNFLEKEYIPKARTTVGWDALPDGAEWYRYTVEGRTTTKLTPAEIHEIGKKEVARIRGEMEKVAETGGYKGDLEGFVKHLKTDAKYYYSSAEELLAGYRAIAKEVDPQLIQLFGKLPRLPYGIKAIPEHMADSAPAAYYQGGSQKAGRAGYFQANTSNLKNRPKWEMEVLTLHEAVPGHHLQISLAQEMENVPEFRKYQGFTAYVEGWGLYAESLGSELGLYKDPASKYGALNFEMWRAIRLVVDTGLHAKGWSREQAIEYMVKNSGKSEKEATVEIDRYIVWPGQALAYKIGEMKLQELRAFAKKELGEKFDIRSFHDTILNDGALPLEMLETKVKGWVSAQKIGFSRMSTVNNPGSPTCCVPEAKP